MIDIDNSTVETECKMIANVGWEIMHDMTVCHNISDTSRNNLALS